MHIVIVGAGTVGFDLAVYLQKEGNDVSLVERDPHRCDEIKEKLDILVAQGSGSSPQALKDAGIHEADMVLAVTSVDEVNILVCGLAEQMKVPCRIARIRSREFAGRRATVDLPKLGITRVINPEQVIVRSIDQIARIPDVVEVFSYHEGQVLIVRHIIKEGMPLVDHSLIDTLKMAEPHRLLAVALKRGDEVRIPAGMDHFRIGDDFTTIVPRDSLPKYLDLLGLTGRRVKKAVVAGNGLTAVLLCERLKTWVEDVTLVDPDLEHANEAAERLDGVEVIHGDPTERDVLREVNVARTDLFVGAGRETTLNVMSTLLAQSEGAPKVIAISFEPQNNRLFQEIGVPYILSPRQTMAHAIMDLIHGARMSMEMQLRDLDLESMSILADKGSKITKGTLMDVWHEVRSQGIVGAIIRGDSTQIPRGDTRIEAGDEVIVVTHPKTARKIKGLFRK